MFKVVNENLQTLKNELDISRTSLEDKWQSVMQGEDAFQDTKLDMWKVDSNIVLVLKDLTNLD